MAEIWETAFADKQLMWGLEPTRSAVFAAERFGARGVTDVLVPGLGYGRNAKPFLARGMAVTGIEISETAIGLARSKLGLTLPIHHGSVTDMPFDDGVYGGIFCHGLLYLLDPAARTKLLEDCARQLAPGGEIVVTLIAKSAPMYGQGVRLGEDWFEILPGMKMAFYDEASVARDFGRFGLVETTTIHEPVHTGATFPFVTAVFRP